MKSLQDVYNNADDDDDNILLSSMNFILSLFSHYRPDITSMVD